MRTLLRIFVLTLTVGTVTSSFAQKTSKLVQEYLNKEQKSLDLTSSDLQNWLITDEHTAVQTNLTHVYVTQTNAGIQITDGVATFVIADGKLRLTGNRFVKDVSSKVTSSSPTISAEEAIYFAATALNLAPPSDLRLTEDQGAFKHVFSASSLSLEAIPVQLVYAFNDENELRLAWKLNIYEHSQDHWWNVHIDAATGEIVRKADWVVSCSFDEHEHAAGEICNPDRQEQTASLPAPPPGADQYNVFAIPLESPNHGPRTLVVNPSDPIASPFGWHDDDGVLGDEYTVTRGNNVRATEDADDNNNPGYSPDGGAALDFDFPLNMVGMPASTYFDASITHLFYMNNIMHDVWYQYGFDEASGNFQENNYGNGGTGSDYVNADAQDGGGTNNANFATPVEGQNPRMQMYLWGVTSPPAADILTINSPAGPAGTYAAEEAGFGPGVPATPITADLVIYEDAVPDTYDACEDPAVPGLLSGKIAVIMRGSCPFVDKIQRAQDDGAVAVIMVNNVGTAPISMGGTSGSITIPGVMVSQADGLALIAAIESGPTVNGTLVNTNPGPTGIDGDFDNGIVAHEYGHGISTRLTGGGSNSDCLQNAEQMGEGWSDWFGLMLTIEPGDLGTDGRGIGTFAQGQPITGNGIRPTRYSTSTGINNSTYASTNNTAGISQPHGIGYVWCTMIWDLNWALIDEYGYDSDVYTGTGGNNIAMNLIMTGLKLQPCSPGFVDGRDAILEADQLLYGGVHECLIWSVFANRGLGFSADQGDTDSRTDQIQAFDMPASIQPVTNATTCTGYLWAVDGQTYTIAGTYTAPIAGGIGCDTVATLNLTIITGLVTVVIQNQGVLTASQPNLGYQWIDCDNNFALIPGATNQSYVPTVSGNYAVILTGNGCIDTSACYIALVDASISENDFGPGLILYPNPTDGGITIDLGESHQGVEVHVLDITGRIISTDSFVETSSFDLELTGTAGIYFVEIISESGKKAQIKVQKTE
ncbi:MAG: extracellular elastinolytic metalloproteinase [Crocinitomicaceae bacterium]|jgi:extracellular elastinolytic metalloproteinase